MNNRERSGESLSTRLKKLDYHTSVSQEFRVHTGSGAILSVVTLLIIICLTYTEFQYNFTPTIKNNVHVNSTSVDGIDIQFDITFPSVPCALLNIDANDPMGQVQSLHIDRTHRIWKHRLDKDGRMIGHKTRFEMGGTLQSVKHIKKYAEERSVEFEYDDDDFSEYEEECGSCYGAGDNGECCNTCDDVKRAYQRKGWFFDEEKTGTITQCRKQKSSHDEAGEGCNVHGIVALSSGGGDLHMAPGHELEHFGKKVVYDSLADLITEAFETFNVSHTVNMLRFGEEFPGHIHQLDGHHKMIEDAYGMYQYYIKIVPTLYKFLNGTSIQTNQYSVTEHMRHVSPTSNKGLPGVFFFYEVSALHVEIEEYRQGWIRFLTSVAAVIGGVFSAMSVADGYIFSKLGSSTDSLG